jgi:cyclopropane fatty-acyl-phospholipid synthase-like methyltransferase
MTEFELLVDLHKDSERQGPGSFKETKRALEFLKIDQNQELKIADIGCGTGSHTLFLAANTNSRIKAIDLFPQFLEKLKINASNLGYGERIETLIKSMDTLDFAEAEFDIIWSEGAIYNMGFKEGIMAWRKFLKKGGYLVVSEISWITDSRPEEIQQYWLANYSQIDTISNKIEILEQNGYSPMAHFTLPSECWWENYYHPLVERFASFLTNHHHSELAKQIVEIEKTEIELFKKYNEYYNYVFYISRKI